MPRRADTKLRERIEEVAREIGTLLVAFAPLDAMLGDYRLQWKWMSLFFIFGLIFIAASLISEHKRHSAT